MENKLLIVDDDLHICEILEFNLRNEGFLVESVNSAEEAMEVIPNQYSLILLDVMMGGISGYKLAEKLRQEGNTTPIIFLTAKDTENDMLTGFSVGADDYISKPFSIKEVIARIKAILNRNQKQIQQKQNKTEITADFFIDRNLKEVQIDNENIKLTKTEFEILVLLTNSANTIFSREEIIKKAWDENTFITFRTVDVHIARLRKKLGKYSSTIVNRPGFGYRFDLENI